MVAAKSMAIAKEKEIVLRETIKFTVSYDVLGHDVLDKTGIIAREPNSVGKYLVFVADIDEWCEPSTDKLHRLDPGYVSKDARDLLSRTKILEYTEV